MKFLRHKCAVAFLEGGMQEQGGAHTMQTPSIFEDPKIRSLVYKGSPATGGNLGNELNIMHDNVDKMQEQVSKNTNDIALTTENLRIIANGSMHVNQKVDKMISSFEELDKKVAEVTSVLNSILDRRPP